MKICVLFLRLLTSPCLILLLPGGGVVLLSPSSFSNASAAERFASFLFGPTPLQVWLSIVTWKISSTVSIHTFFSCQTFEHGCNENDPTINWSWTTIITQEIFLQDFQKNLFGSKYLENTEEMLQQYYK